MWYRQEEMAHKWGWIRMTVLWNIPKDVLEVIWNIPEECVYT